MYVCTKCNEQKPNSEFSKNITRKTGHNSYCKLCHKNYVAKHYQKNKKTYFEKAEDWKTNNPQKRKDVVNKYAKKNPEKLKNNSLKSLYGITLEEFHNKLSLQQHKCAICNNEFKNSKDAHMDHCHTSGNTRDILCMSCNIGLGYFKDSVPIILAASQYLIKHQS